MTLALVWYTLSHGSVTGCSTNTTKAIPECCHCIADVVPLLVTAEQLSRDMRFPTIWYVRPAKAQTSLRIRAD